MDFIKVEDWSFYVTFAAYLIATLLYFTYAAFRNENLGKGGTLAAAVGLLANTVLLLVRWKNAGHPPLSNGYEFLVSFTWGIVLIYMFAEWKYNLRMLGAFVMPVAWLLLAAVLMFLWEQRTPSELMPVLRSNWLYIHVATSIISYGAFAVSFGLAVMYLIKEAGERSGSQGALVRVLPATTTLEELAYRFIVFGFIFLSIVIISGAIWAEFAWGRYWSWDPKETWSLITWIIYAAYLHTRLMLDWRGRRAIFFAILGFIAVLFTFFGVNYFLPGLHSYA